MEAKKSKLRIVLDLLDEGLINADEAELLLKAEEAKAKTIVFTVPISDSTIDPKYFDDDLKSDLDSNSPI